MLGENIEIRLRGDFRKWVVLDVWRWSGEEDGCEFSASPEGANPNGCQA